MYNMFFTCKSQDFQLCFNTFFHAFLDLFEIQLFPSVTSENLMNSHGIGSKLFQHNNTMGFHNDKICKSLKVSHFGCNTHMFSFNVHSFSHSSK